MKSSLVLAIALSLFWAEMLTAQWSNDVNENTPVSLFTGLPTLVPDGENGVIVFSQSRDVNPLLRAQRVSVKGELLWPGLQGVRVSSAVHDQWIRPPFSSDPRFVLSDAEGGGYIAYQVGRIIGQEEEPPDNIYAISVFVQRIDSSGDWLFGDEGLRLMPVLPDTFEFTQQIMNMIPDGEGGVYVLWTMTSLDSTRFNGIYQNRVAPDGRLLWDTRTLFAGNASRTLAIKYIPYLDRNKNLNLYEYSGETNPPGQRPDTFLKVSKNTGEIISQREIEIGTGEYGFSAFFDYTQSDGGSAIFAFHDFRGDTLRAQKLDGDGNQLWGEEPIILAHSLKGRTLFEIDSDKVDGAYVWYQSVDTVLTVSHLDNYGLVTWKMGFKGHHGQGFSTILPAATHHRPMVVSSGGSVFVLSDGFHVLNKISRSGDMLWQTQISNRGDIAANIDDFSALADSDGGCTVIWEEVGSFVGLRAQRVDRYGNLGGTTPVKETPSEAIPRGFILEPPHPNPFNDTVKIAFSIPESADISLKVYDILGREVMTLKEEKLFGGRHAVLWDGSNPLGRKLSSGIYVLVLRSGRVSVSEKLLLLK